MKIHESEFSVRKMCKTLDVAPNHYYQHRNGPPGPRAKENSELTRQIESIFESTDHGYGSPRITHQLRQDGWCCGENRAAKLMRINGIRARKPPRFVPATTDSNHPCPIAESLLGDLPQVVAYQSGVDIRSYISPSARPMDVPGCGDESVQSTYHRMVISRPSAH